jgi:DNA recombination protein RmuC
MSVPLNVLIAAGLGVLAGAVIAWLIAHARSRQLAALAAAALQAQTDVAQGQIAGLERVVRDRDAGLETARRALEAQAAELRGLGEARASQESLIRSERQSYKDRQADFERAEQRLREAFGALAAGALQANREAFLSLATTKFQEFRSEATTDLEGRRRSIDDVLDPMREKLSKVETTLAAVEEARREAYGGLREQLTRLDRETGNLATALRAPHVRGRWGELQLRRVVEMAGMVEHCDFDEQASVATEGGLLRPDLVVRLAGGRSIVIDAKAPVSAYQEAFEQAEPEARERKLREHAAQVRDHVRKLAAKSYWEQFADTPDFVVLFLPAEPFFSTALQYDPDLLEFGAQLKVIPASPLTLLALLRTVAHGWRQEKLAQSAEAIRDLGRELYERLCVMGDHFVKLGSRLNGAVEAHNNVVASLEGRVLVSARKFKDLGVSSTKDLDALSPVEHVTRRLQAPELADDASAVALDADVVGESSAESR